MIRLGGGGAASPAPLTAWNTDYIAGNDGTPIHTDNTLSIFGIVIPAAIYFGNISISVVIDDATHNYDFGLYNSAGHLIANVGASKISATNVFTLPTLQGYQTIPAGLYWFALTGVATTLDINQGLQIMWDFAINFGSSVGGVLPANISRATPVPAQNVTPAFLLN